MNNLELAENFGNMIVSARKSLRMSQKQLADKVGVSRDLIVRLEGGDNVGIHYVLAVVSTLCHKITLQIDAEIPIEGLDAFQQNTFGEIFKSDIRKRNPGEPNKPVLSDNLKSRIKVLNWNK